jgi:transposase
MRPFGSPKFLEARRRRAMALLGGGRSLTEVARKVGCHPSAVMRWRNAARRGGPGALCAKAVPGRPARLRRRQTDRLVRLLLQGPLSRGYSTDVWTTKRIADLIAAEFGVRYHRDHVGRLLHRLRWSCQKPDRRALERNEERIEQWKREEWPRIKKGRCTWAPTSSSWTNPASC